MPPKRKKNATSKNGGNEVNESNIASLDPPASSSTSSSANSSNSLNASRSSPRKPSSTNQITRQQGTRRSTQNATKLPTKRKISNETELELSEDSDFENHRNVKSNTSAILHTSSTSTSSTLTSTAKSKKKVAVENLSSSKNYIKKEDSDIDMKQASIDGSNSSGSGSDGGSEFHMDDDQSSEDDEWEEVEVAASGYDIQEEEYEEEEELSGPWQYNAVEIVFDKPLDEIKRKSKNKGITKEERMIRVLIHQTHILCLIANGLRRNRWIRHDKLCSIGLSLVPSHIAMSVQTKHKNLTREITALQVLALWWRDSFVVTGPGIRSHEYMDMDVVGAEAVFPSDSGECIKQRKNLQRKLSNRVGSTDVCSQLFTAICHSLGLKTRLVESLQACSFKISLPKIESKDGQSSQTKKSPSSSTSKKGKKKEVELDESDTTRGSRVVLATPHRLTKKPAKLPINHKSADPPVFWTEVYSQSSNKWIPIDPVRGYKRTISLENYVTDVTRRYTSAWSTTTKKLRVQPAGNNGFDWWAQTMSGLVNPYRTFEEGLEEEELLKSETMEQMPSKLGDFNNHPIYALERHIKKYEVLHPRIPVLGHIRGEAIYPRSCVKQVRSKESWLKRGQVIKGDEEKPVKWVKSHAATILQLRLRQQIALSGGKEKMKANDDLKQRIFDDNDDYKTKSNEAEADAGDDKTPLFGEWQVEAYQPPWVIDGKVPRNQYGRQDVFTPAMVPIGGTHLKGRGIGKVARLLGVDFVEAVTGFEFQSRKSVPLIQGIIVPTEQAELVLDAYYEIEHQRDQEAHKRKRVEVLKRWRKLIKGVLLKSRLMEEYGDDSANKEDDWMPGEDEEEVDNRKENGRDSIGSTKEAVKESIEECKQTDTSQAEQDKDEAEDSGGGYMFE
ncbi:hypothetical protein BGZ76_008965 [Entomortierella beljakovae]|nr:hypothetical protein BGZ76_008965 [Entomortierella beljakovae]